MATPKKRKARKPAIAKTPATVKERALVLLRTGASLAQLAEALGWQKTNSVRGLISTINQDVKIISAKADEKGAERIYRVAKRQ